MAILSGAATPAQYPIIWSTLLTQTAHSSFRGAAYHALLQLLRPLRHGSHRPPCRGPGVDSQVLGRNGSRGSNQLLGGLRYPLAHQQPARLATGRWHLRLLRLAGARVVVRPHLMADGRDTRHPFHGSRFPHSDATPRSCGPCLGARHRPTPHGPIDIDLKPTQTNITLPAGIELSVLVPISPGHKTILLNGKAVTPGPLSEDGTRATVVLSQPGTYTLQTQ